MTYLVSILIYLSILVLVGIYKAKSVKDSEDFMVAGRTLPWYILVGTLLATWMGSGSLFSGAGLGYRNGLAGLWSSGGAWLGIALIYFISRRIRNFGKVTVPDIFEARYGKAPAILATITTVIAYTTTDTITIKHDVTALSNGIKLRYNWYSNPCGIYCFECAIYIKVKPLGFLTGMKDFLPLAPFIVDL